MSDLLTDIVFAVRAKVQVYNRERADPGDHLVEAHGRTWVKARHPSGALSIESEGPDWWSCAGSFNDPPTSRPTCCRTLSSSNRTPQGAVPPCGPVCGTPPPEPPPLGRWSNFWLGCDEVR
jgi:hypothetical protein